MTGVRALLVAAALFSAGAVDRATAQLNATLVLDAPKPLTVWIDGAWAGSAPCTIDSLAGGTKTLLLLPAARAIDAWGSAWRQSVDLGAGRTERVRLPLLGLLRVTTGEVPVEVRLAGAAPESRRLGRTPLAIYAPREAPFEIELIDPVGGRTLRTVDFAGRDSLQLVVDLSIVPSRPMSEEVRRSLRGRDRARVVLPIAALAAGAAGIWARHQADDAYDDYLATTDRDRMRARLAEADRWDRVAAGCWIGAEGCLAGALWLWLRPGSDEPLGRQVATTRVGVDLLGVIR
ncbi:MAG: hypothetical protein IT349_03260 [Candidatus Eisenbacteria bacterium]|nr:hypothetical protein [Candidatus Eisenbacteria bacterium]